MKPVVVLLTASIVSGEIAEAKDESFALLPHVECDTSAPELTKEVCPATNGGATGAEPLGRFRQRVFYSKMLRARQNHFAMLNAFADTARMIMQSYPGLQPWERKVQYDLLNYEINLTKLRSRGVRDFSGALPAVAQALGVLE